MPMLGEIALLEVASLGHVQLAHLAIGILHGFGRNRDHTVAVFIREAVVPFRAYQANQRGFFADRIDVFVLEVNALAGAFAARLHAGLALPDHDHIVADAEERVEYAGADALPIAEQQYHCRQAPNDAHHRQDRAKPVARERIPTLLDQFLDLHRRLLNFATPTSLILGSLTPDGFRYS